MFKKSVITDEISQDFQVAVQLAVKYRLDAVEIRSVWDKNPEELNADDVEKIKEILNREGLAVSGIAAPIFKCDIDNQEEYNAHLKILKKCIQLSEELDTKYIRGFTFWAKGNLDDYLEIIAEKFREPVKLLRSSGKILVLESDPSVFASNAEQLRKVLDKINSPYVKALWDPGNDIYDPAGERPYPEGYEHIKPYMVHMHLKDAVITEEGAKSVPIGAGAVDYKAHFKRLIQDRYQGYVTLETHYRPKHDLSKDLLELPKGTLFSRFGYEATEECLINWEKLMGEIEVQ